MTYIDEVTSAAAAWQDEIRADLARTNELLGRSRSEMAEHERRAAVLTWLLDLVDAETVPVRGRTLHEAMVEVLRAAPRRMMRAGDLAAVINDRGLYRMRDGRPVEAQQVHARVGHYAHLFTREGTFIKLVDEK